MRVLGDEADGDVRLYFTGGATAVLLGWRASTVAQALSKIQRGHAKDLEDVRAMIERGLVDREGLRLRFEQIEPELYRYPAIDPKAFRSALEQALAQ